MFKAVATLYSTAWQNQVAANSDMPCEHTILVSSSLASRIRQCKTPSETLEDTKCWP